MIGRIRRAVFAFFPQRVKRIMLKIFPSESKFLSTFPPFEYGSVLLPVSCNYMKVSSFYVIILRSW